MKTVAHYKWGAYLPITEPWIYNQINNLKNYRPIVYCLNKENLDIYPTELVRSLELSPKIKNLTVSFYKAWGELFNFCPFFYSFLRKDKPDLIHAHFGPSGYHFLELKKIFKLPLITAFYGLDVSWLVSQRSRWRKRYEKLFREGELFLAEGNYMKNCLIQLGCPCDKVIVQHHGVDLNRIKFKPRGIEADDEIRILVFGRFAEKKGIPYAVEAFGLVKQAHPNLNLKLTIIGDSDGGLKEEREKEKILNTIKKYNLQECIRLSGLGPQCAFLAELLRHHIFMHPSIQAADGNTEGGAPVSIIEASASGMPILSTKHCDIPEVVVDGESGYLVPERNIGALRERLEFLVLNPGLWEKMGLVGRKHIEENYNIEKQIQKLEDIYDKVISKHIT
jgi:colanic acid/amylovoran biosynthesis glycosyltransferase